MISRAQEAAALAADLAQSSPRYMQGLCLRVKEALTCASEDPEKRARVVADLYRYVVENLIFVDRVTGKPLSNITLKKAGEIERKMLRLEALAREARQEAAAQGVADPALPAVPAWGAYAGTLWRKAREGEALPSASRPLAGWEADARPLADVLKDWHAAPGRGRDWAADTLCVPRATYDGWCAGRPSQVERLVRRMMNFVDGLG